VSLNKMSSQLKQNQDEKLKDTLLNLAAEFRVDICTQEFALRMDQIDPLLEFRSLFNIPLMKDLLCVDVDVDGEEEIIYLCGNSLGLKPKKANVYMQSVLDSWAKLGVLSHFNGDFPAALSDLMVKDSLANVVGALPEEVICMNGLTVNIHLLLVSFYQPTESRYKIIIEDHAFPSDRYAVISQLELHGYSEQNGLIILKSQPGEHHLRTEDICSAIEENGASVALVFLSGVHYYTGQKFDIEAITRCGQKQGCVVGWDLAHAVGNVELKLHDWNADFATWCSYKYLNAGAGGISGIFVHQRHHSKNPKLIGWWSNKHETRFEMKYHADVAPGADAYRMSNPPPTLIALHKAGLEIFETAGIERLLEKQYLLTGYLEYLMDRLNIEEGSGSNNKKLLDIITLRDPQQRGCQLSVTFSIPLEHIHQRIEKMGVLCDIRLPSVMRLAPVPLYNSFNDVYRFYKILEKLIATS